MSYTPFKTGTATLVGGEIQVADTNITANSRIFLTPSDDSGTIGIHSVSGATGSGFTINSSNILDTSVMSYLIVY